MHIYTNVAILVLQQEMIMVKCMIVARFGILIML